MPGALAIVVIDPAFLGDVVFDGPLVRTLVRDHPGARIGLVVRPPAQAIARRIVGVHDVHVFDKYRVDRGIGGLRRVARELAASRYDVALIPHPSLRSAVLARMAAIPVRTGSARWPVRALLTDVRPCDPTATHIGARLALAGPRPAPGRAPEILPGLAIDPAPLAGSLERRTHPPATAGTRVALVLGANWATKRWPVERAADLVGALDASVTVVLVGSDAERPLASELRSVLAARPPPAAEGAGLEDAMGGSIDELLDRLGTCHLAVGGDTGPMHAARAMGLPAVLLFGPTPEAAHDVTDRDRVLTVPVSCRPCDAHGPTRCPLVHHRCLRDLDAARVLRAIRELAPMS